jgi:hypothetical protein
LVVEVTVVSAHVLLNIDFRVYFALGGAAAGQEGLYLWAVFL